MSDEIELNIEVDEEAYEVKAIKAFLAKEISLEDLQVSLELGRAQTYRLVKRYKSEGPNGLISRNIGNRNRAHPEKKREQILSIVRERYPDFGPTLAAEKLKEIPGWLSPGQLDLGVEQRSYVEHLRSGGRLFRVSV